MFLGAVPISAQQPLTPTEVVFQWLHWFPKNLAKAATLTTANLRDGLSSQDWVVKNGSLLKDLQFKYLEGKVIEESREGREASVTIETRLYLVIGEVRQVETYSLKQVKGRWLIDSQEIREDHVIGRTL